MQHLGDRLMSTRRFTIKSTLTSRAEEEIDLEPSSRFPPQTQAKSEPVPTSPIRTGRHGTFPPPEGLSPMFDQWVAACGQGLSSEGLAKLRRSDAALAYAKQLGIAA